MRAQPRGRAQPRLHARSVLAGARVQRRAPSSTGIWNGWVHAPSRGSVHAPIPCDWGTPRAARILSVGVRRVVAVIAALLVCAAAQALAAQSRTAFVALAVTADGRGYWTVTAAGRVTAYGDAPHYGSAGSALPGRRGRHRRGARRLRVLARDRSRHRAGVRARRSYGSARARPGERIVAIAAAPDGRGYWVVAADGRVRRFGDARLFGHGPAACTTSSRSPSRPVGGATGSHPRRAGSCAWRRPLLRLGAREAGRGDRRDPRWAGVLARHAGGDGARVRRRSASAPRRATHLRWGPSWASPPARWAATGCCTRERESNALPAPSPGFIPGHVTAIGDSVMLDVAPDLEADIPASTCRRR